MSTLAIFATAVALAMDAFAVAVASGIRLRRVDGRQTFRLAWHFGLFQAVMPIAGWTAGAGIHGMIAQIDHWIAFSLLVFVGGKMLGEAARGSHEAPINSDPTRGRTLILLSFATSIDAFAVGFSLSMLEVSVWWPALVIGLVAGGFTAAGMQLGRILGKGAWLRRSAEIIGGMVLIAIAFDILRDHGVFG